MPLAAQAQSCSRDVDGGWKKVPVRHQPLRTHLHMPLLCPLPHHLPPSLSSPSFFNFCLFETESHCVDQAGLDITGGLSLNLSVLFLRQVACHHARPVSFYKALGMARALLLAAFHFRW